MSIATEIERLQNAKASMKTAIENKGVEVGDATIDAFADKINEISVGTEGNPFVEFVSGDKKVLTASDLAGATQIRAGMFSSIDLTSVECPSSLVVIGNSAFSAVTNLVTFKFNDRVERIGSSCFYNCRKLQDFTFPSALTTILGYAFTSCYALTKLEFPDGITIHEQYSFDACTSIKKIVFGSGATTIRTNAFRGCSALELCDFRKCKQIPTLQTDRSLDHASGCKIVVPDEFYDTWQASTNWVALANVVWVKASEYVEE